MKQYNILM